MREQQVRPRRQPKTEPSTEKGLHERPILNKLLAGRSSVNLNESISPGIGLPNNGASVFTDKAGVLLHRIGLEFSPRDDSRLWQLWDGMFAPSRLGFLLAVVVLTITLSLMGLAQPSSLFFANSGLGTAEFILSDEDSFFLYPYTIYRGDQDASFSGYTEVDTSNFTAVSVNTYTVSSGDTLSDIALRFGLEMDTLVSYNQISDVRRMQIGTVLNVPNRDGLAHIVRSGQTLETIARQYGVQLNQILDANALASDKLAIGQTLFIPNARMNRFDLAIAIGELFLTPTHGYLSSTFGYRADPFTGQRRFHNGIDLASARGTAIRAAMPGRVVHVESQTGNYGKYIIIQHDRGFQTLYAHLDAFSVSRGQYVSQGQIVGRMGSTGRSTGPHLHFSVIRNGAFVNPLDFLKL